MTVEERVDVGMRIVWRIFLMAIAIAFLYVIRDVVLLVFLALIMSAALSPAIRSVRRLGFSRPGAVILVYAAVLFVFAALFAVLIPVLVKEIRDFAVNWPVYSDHFGKSLEGITQYLQPFGIAFDKQTFFQNIEQNVSDSFSGIFSTTVSFFSGIISVLGFFFLSLYISLEEKGIEKFFILVTPERYHSYARSIAERMQGKVSQWLVGQLLIMLIIFAMYFIGLSFLQIPYALALAFFGGLLEIIPYLGPILAAIPAVVLGFLSSNVLGFSTLAFYLIAHQFEGQVIAPQVMKRSVGISPVVLIVAILVGAKVAGVIGVLLAVPTVMLLSVFVEDFLEKREIAPQIH